MAYVNALEVFYPIGSCYLSMDPTSPAEIIGGTWAQITGKYLRAANDTDTGGSNSHQHSATGLSAAIGSSTGNSASLAFAATAPPNWFTNGANVGVTYSLTGTNISNNGWSHGTKVVGLADSTTVEPVYQNIYCWRRTA